MIEDLRSQQTERYPLSRWYLGALRTAADRENPDRLAQAGNSLREILENLPKSTGVQVKKPDKGAFDAARNTLKKGVKRGKKETYKDGWDGLIDQNLKKTLEALEEYVVLIEGPTRQQNTAEGILRSNPVHEVSSKDRRDLLASKFAECDGIFQKFTHHTLTLKNEAVFYEALRLFERLLQQVFNPSAVDVQKAVRVFVNLDPDALDEAKLRKIFTLLKRRPADGEFFFKNLKRPTWLKTLDEHGFFSTPTPLKKLENNYVQVPLWFPMLYLLEVAAQLPGDAVAICCRIPKSDNPRVYADILKVALSVAELSLSIQLLPKIREGIAVRSHPFNDQYGKIIAHWAGEEVGFAAALEIAQGVLAFQPDPREEEKVARRAVEPSAWDTMLEPLATFESWSYQQIITEGIMPLSRTVPLETAHLLIRILCGYIDLKFHAPDDVFERRNGEDGSHIWCRNIQGHEQMHREPNRAVTHALTSTCEEVCRRGNLSEISEMDNALRKARWKVFARIRHYVYSQFPSLFRDQIRESILTFSDYPEDDYGREMVQMIRAAIQHYGADILSADEFGAILALILKGPDKEAFKKALGDDFTEDKFLRHRDYVHRQQLWPFEAILTGEALQRFTEARAILRSPPSLGDYSPVEMEGHNLISQSAFTEDELAAMPDNKLIELLNTWDQRRLDQDRWWVTTDLDGLVGAFSKCLAKHPLRFAEWDEQWDQLERPVFLRAAVDVGNREIGAGKFTSLDVWLRVCRIALKKPISVEVDPKELSDESAEKPRWERVRSAVQTLLQAGIKDQGGFPVSCAPTLIDMVENLCLGPDTTLDRVDPERWGGADPISTAINTTRGRSIELMETLVFWLRRAAPELAMAVAQRFTLTIDLRFEGHPPLADAEQALLGQNIGQLLAIDRAWVLTRMKKIFGREPLSHWFLTFGSFLRFTHGHYAFPLFDVLRGDYEFALNSLAALRLDDQVRSQAREAAVDSLGMHLFCLYLRGAYPLAGNGSLLASFLGQATAQELEKLLRGIGDYLTQVPVREDSRIRAQEFLEVRITVAELAAVPPTEFEGLYGWLKNTSFPPEWRLSSLLRLLNLGMPVNAAALYVECLQPILEGNLALVVECFAKISEHAKSPAFYVDPKEGREIMLAGLNSSDASIKELARKAQENLVGAGHSSFLD